MSANDRSIPSLMAVTMTLFGVTWKRLLRGRALWVCALIAALPALVAFGLRGDRDMAELMRFAQFRVMAILPPIFVASSIGEEIEDRTITYMWSRPIARWSLLLGKIATLAPVAAVLSAAGWAIATVITGKPINPQELAAFALGSVAVSLIAAGIATLVPKQGMALAIIYLVVVDPTMGSIPASIREISVTKQVWLMSGLNTDGSATRATITLVILAGIWLAIGLARIRRLES
ncbi:MAG TPA: ABC transporter permease [Kofleriaceae bacterium]|nr:ABC transporter permease [Kofleriaceae bacterium]